MGARNEGCGQMAAEVTKARDRPATFMGVDKGSILRTWAVEVVGRIRSLERRVAKREWRRAQRARCELIEQFRCVRTMRKSLTGSVQKAECDRFWGRLLKRYCRALTAFNEAEDAYDMSAGETHDDGDSDDDIDCDADDCDHSDSDSDSDDGADSNTDSDADEDQHRH